MLRVTHQQLGREVVGVEQADVPGVLAKVAGVEHFFARACGVVDGTRLARPKLRSYTSR